MATVTGLTAERMQELSDAFIVDATVNAMGNLIVTTAGGTEIDAGPIILYGTANQYYRGDKQWATLDKNAVGLSNVDNVSVRTEYIPKWLANVVYKAGSLVISPYGELVKAKTWHGSATYSSSNWASVISGEKVLTRGNYALNPLAIGSANGFATYQTATGDTGTQTLVTGAVDGPLPEITTYARWVATTAKTSGSSGWRAESSLYFAPTTGASGDQRTVDIYVRYTGAGTLSITPRISFYNGSTFINNGPNGTTVALQSGVWTRLSASGTANGAFTNVGWWAFSTTGANIPAGGKIEATGVLVSTFSAPFFSGATPKNADLEYAWNGAVNNSASYEYSVSDSAFIPKWKTGKVYAVGDQVVTPTGRLMTANAAHTAAAAFATDISKWNAGPEAQGRVLKQNVATSSGNIGVPETVVFNIPTYTFKGGRKYRIEWDSDWLAASANTAADFMISTCSTADAAGVTTGLTRIGLRTHQVALANVSGAMRVAAYYEPTVDTTVQIKFTAGLANGSTFIVQGNRAGKVEYIITDEGAQY